MLTLKTITHIMSIKSVKVIYIKHISPTILIIINKLHFNPSPKTTNTHTRISILTNASFIATINDSLNKINSSTKATTTKKLVQNLNDTLQSRHGAIFNAVYSAETARISRPYMDKDNVNLMLTSSFNVARLNMDFDVMQLGRLSINIDCTKDTNNVSITKIGGGYNKPARLFSSPNLDASEIASFTSQSISSILADVAIN
jgi:hypothetical protein